MSLNQTTLVTAQQPHQAIEAAASFIQQSVVTNQLTLHDTTQYRTIWHDVT